MGYFWLTLTLLFELIGYAVRYWIGIWFSSYLLSIYSLFPKLAERYPVTSEQIGWAFIVLSLVLHIVVAVRQCTRPQLERVTMRLRSPSKREMELVERCYKQMQQKAMLLGTLSFAHPPRFRVYQGDGYEVRFVGNTLVINYALFQATGSSYLGALLAHALWSFNSSGLRVHHLLQLFPETDAILFLFLGRFLTSILWCWYERSQVYLADAYAVRLGQKQTLIQTLEELFLPLDMPRKQLLYTEPYIEARIDRIHYL
jgi:hypothetical protein